ncbi:MAG: hypothetical protein D6768_07005 [Chloroflexi bacterium]|nr:MAG: hypothetical protein D6768_07005 [Chloroflexota bacterium]
MPIIIPLTGVVVGVAVWVGVGVEVGVGVDVNVAVGEGVAVGVGVGVNVGVLVGVNVGSTVTCITTTIGAGRLLSTCQPQRPTKQADNEQSSNRAVKASNNRR